MTDSTDDLSSVLTGTTLRIYKAMIAIGRPIGPRELQKVLGLSSSSVPIFHLEKLERAGLTTRNIDGLYTINRLYLKHFFLIRRMLVPRFIFQASLATFFLLGWILLYYARNFRATLDQAPSDSSIILLIFLYGLVVAIMFASFSWFETLRVLRQEKI